VNSPNALWCVVADLPESRPVLASTKAPVQTDMVRSALFADLRSQSMVAGVLLSCAGMTTIFGGGALAKSWSGTIFIPPLARMGRVVSATV